MACPARALLSMNHVELPASMSPPPPPGGTQPRKHHAVLSLVNTPTGTRLQSSSQTMGTIRSARKTCLTQLYLPFSELCQDEVQADFCWPGGEGWLG